MADFVPPKREKHYLDDFKLRLIADPLPGSQKRPTLHVSVINNNPRVDVWTNKDGDKNNGSIQGKMDAVGFSTLIERFKFILNSAIPKSQISLVCSRPGQNRGEVIREATVVCGLDDNGIAYMSVVAADPDRPKIKFMFGNTQFQTLVAGNGQKLTDSEISISFALGWINLIKETMWNVLTDKYVHKEPGEKKSGGGGYEKKPWQGGQGGGGNSNWKDRQSNQQRQPEPAAAGGDAGGGGFDDDLPF